MSDCHSRHCCEKNGLDVVTAESGEQALTVASREDNFDLLIVDMGMPGMNGAETIAALDKQGFRLPTVVFSGWSVPTVMGHFAQQPPPDYVLTKPLNLEELERLLDDVRARLAPNEP